MPNSQHPKSRENLKRGKLGPLTPEQYKSNGDRLREGLARAKEAEARIDELSLDNPSHVIRMLHAEAAKTALKGYRKWNQSGRANDDDRRFLIESSREARQLTDRLLLLIEAEGSATQAESFFTELQERVETLAPLLAQSAHPIAEATPGPVDVLEPAGDV